MEEQDNTNYQDVAAALQQRIGQITASYEGQLALMNAKLIEMQRALQASHGHSHAAPAEDDSAEVES